MRWWQSSTAGDIKPIPFLAPQVIKRLEELIQPDWRILEHGSGGSTLWFAERCKFVAAYEDNLNWYDSVKKHLEGKINFYLSPYGNPPIGATAYIDFDLVLIDGEPLEKRAEWIKASPDLLRPGGVVVLDNANREQFATERKWLQNNCEHFETFDCNEHSAEHNTTYLVTEFYFLKG